MSDDLPAEADRADGAPHPRETAHLFGQGDAEAAFLEAVAQDRLHHAWLLTGPKGVGKATLAWRLARFLLAEAPADAGFFGDAPPTPTSLDIPRDHPVARRIAALSEPGLLLIRRAWDSDRKKLKSQITVDEVRKLNEFFGLTATDGGRRIVIVDAADELNPSAANALLKVLEEPPKRAVLILVSHQPARLLPTIRSRCRTLRLGEVGPEDMARALSQAGVTPEDGLALSELAQGSVGEAIRLLSQDGPGLYATIVRLISGGPRMDRQALRAFAENVTVRGAEERQDLAVRLLNLALVRLARTGAGRPPLAEAAPGEIEAWRRLAPDAGRAQVWATLQQELSSRIAHGRAVNIDAQSLLTDAFLRIDEAARD
ncbi:DNA polymerase III subunit delta' [Silicimonas algicola]|uniref:DNA polymerase III delta prime subunit n=1 Tax=Silicimonas algicola TaxID=1826607 RepID=A0A316G2X0_9RHOB|nr:DNA polymerase III subunit delta' [Silicimonas algicola]AZQ66926.1 DNA polymerase III subunit delta' [Silicimonas algicola]PWK55158.1 DNA polymerase III delta prime subunit [Silicimonas algicola]